MLNFISNLGAYGHNLLAYERNARGASLDPGVNLHPGANLHPVANCAYEHGFRFSKGKLKTMIFFQKLLQPVT